MTIKVRLQRFKFVDITKQLDRILPGRWVYSFPCYMLFFTQYWFLYNGIISYIVKCYVFLDCMTVALSGHQLQKDATVVIDVNIW